MKKANTLEYRIVPGTHMRWRVYSPDGFYVDSTITRWGARRVARRHARKKMGWQKHEDWIYIPK